MKICTVCNKEFRAMRSDAKYCSAICRVRRGRGVPMDKENPIEVVGEVSGEPRKVWKPLKVIHNKFTDSVCSPNEDSSAEEREVFSKILDNRIEEI
jgi:hypothetical protein